MRRRAFLFLTGMAVGVLTMAGPARADTFVVNSTGDSGDQSPLGVCNTAPFPAGTEPECTLRAAIQEANATAVEDTINFFIGGSGVKTISPSSPLPSITEPVTINGYSEPGASANTKAVGTNAVLLVELDGTDVAQSQAGLVIAAQNSVVRGLVVNRFDGHGIEVDGTEHATIEGNFIGTNPAGTADRGNGGSGVSTSGPDTTVGGASRAARNLISGNGLSGFATGDFDSRVQGGNLIGTDRTAMGPLGNDGNGVSLYRRGTVGGDNAAFANVIAFNGGDGVAVRDTGNRILGGSVFSNDDQGIDLGDDGPTPNDGPGDADTGPNNLQNFPALSSAKTGRTATTIRGTLGSTRNATFIVQFFSNPKNTRDEGKKFVGQKTVADGDGDGVVSFTFKPKRKVKAGTFVTATATNVATGDTSEFSAPRKVRG